LFGQRQIAGDGERIASRDASEQAAIESACASSCLRDAYFGVVLGCRLIDGARNLLTGGSYSWPARSGQCDNGDAAARQVLLILQVRVGRDLP